MIQAVVLVFVVMTVSSAPTDTQYTINIDGPDGRHVQMGEPGKAVSGYYASRSLDGQMEYKTMYEADENGYRARGDHLPAAAAAIPATAGVRSLDVAPGYVFNYEAPGSHSHYQMGQPGKAVHGSFMFYDAEGRSQRVDYVADENGYRVKPAEDKIASSQVVPIAAADSVVEEAAQSSEIVPAVPALVSEDPIKKTAESGEVENSFFADPAIPASAEPIEIVEKAVDPVLDDAVPADEIVVVSAPALTAAGVENLNEPVPVVAAADSVVAVSAPVAQIVEESSKPIQDAVDPVQDVAAPADETVVNPASSVLETLGFANSNEPVLAVAAAEIAPAIQVSLIEDPIESAPETVVVQQPTVSVSQQVAEAVKVAAEKKSSNEIQPKLIALSVSTAYPNAAYFRNSLPYVQPIFRYSPYPYAYGYGYPYATNYVYGF